MNFPRLIEARASDKDKESDNAKVLCNTRDLIDSIDLRADDGLREGATTLGATRI
jgi:hypothetical protein